VADVEAAEFIIGGNPGGGAAGKRSLGDRARNWLYGGGACGGGDGEFSTSSSGRAMTSAGVMTGDGRCKPRVERHEDLPLGDSRDRDEVLDPDEEFRSLVDELADEVVVPSSVSEWVGRGGSWARWKKESRYTSICCCFLAVRRPRSAMRPRLHTNLIESTRAQMMGMPTPMPTPILGAELAW